LHYPAPDNTDKPLNAAAADKICDYGTDYNNLILTFVSVKPAVEDTSGQRGGKKNPFLILNGNMSLEGQPELELVLREIRAYESENFMMESMYRKILETASGKREAEKSETTTGKKRGKDKERIAVSTTLTIQQKITLNNQMIEEQNQRLKQEEKDANSMLFELQCELDSLVCGYGSYGICLFVLCL
jgi:hypothetical protein